jgi:hypothetical protein
VSAARGHARSAASAISKIADAAPGLPIRYTTAAARWSRQMAPIPLRANIVKASLSVTVLWFIRAILCEEASELCFRVLPQSAA